MGGFFDGYVEVDVSPGEANFLIFLEIFSLA
jgi:hypothetical protein